MRQEKFFWGKHSSLLRRSVSDAWKRFIALVPGWRQPLRRRRSDGKRHKTFSSSKTRINNGATTLSMATRSITTQHYDECHHRGILEGKASLLTVDLLFDWFGLVCFANKNKNCRLSYSWFQASQTGGQWYSDTSLFSIPWSHYDECRGAGKISYSVFTWQSIFKLVQCPD